MKIEKIPFAALPQISKTDRSYSEQNEILKKYYKYSVDIQSFKKVIEDKSKEKTDRLTLVETLKRQFQNLHKTQNTLPENIEKLASEQTFTVTTAHQPSLLTGPLYFIYKIFSTIRLAENLKKAYPDQYFVPIFVIGGEDHDFEEVNNTTLFNKKIVWENTEKGSVGMMKTDTLQAVLAELKAVLGNSETAENIYQIIENAYTKNAIYHDATQALLYDLFGKYGLLVLNMNDTALKRLFVPLMQHEVKTNFSKKYVLETQNALEADGFKAQAFARDINLFYMREGLRERIVFENDVYTALNTDYKWTSQAALLAEINDTPQYFSPNVVLRPLYQELVLPNLAYIGGGGELAYWLERKTQFESVGINFPMLIRRNSVLWLDKNTRERLDKFSLQVIDLAGDIDIFIKEYVKKQATDTLDFSAEKQGLEAVFTAVLEKALATDASLEKAILAEKTKQLQSLDALESRIHKAEKQKHETALNQIKTLAQKMYPNGGLQERVENFLPIYIKNGASFFDVLYQNLDPLEQGFLVINAD